MAFSTCVRQQILLLLLGVCATRQKVLFYGAKSLLENNFLWHFGRREECACTALIGAQGARARSDPWLWLHCHRKLFLYRIAAQRAIFAVRHAHVRGFHVMFFFFRDVSFSAWYDYNHAYFLPFNKHVFCEFASRMRRKWFRARCTKIGCSHQCVR